MSDHVKMGISLHEDVPREVFSIVRSHAVPAGQTYGEFRRYWVEPHHVARIQEIMREHVGAQEAPRDRRRRYV